MSGSRKAFIDTFVYVASLSSGCAVLNEAEWAAMARAPRS
jgi:hypothetical protein